MNVTVPHHLKAWHRQFLQWPPTAENLLAGQVMRFLMQMDTIDPRLYSISMVKVESLLLPVHVCTSEKLSAWAEMDDDSDESSFHRLQQLASIYCLIHQARSKRDTFS
ncbi:hypothetical protein C8J56DRAFT_1165515 [Mycena floridula]|nr:hypothetical protein C8J56DRAFT_1165515 [Mycena floridula]